MIAFKLKLLMNKTHKKNTKKKKQPRKENTTVTHKTPQTFESNFSIKKIYSEMIKNKPYDFEFLIRKIFQREIPQIYEYYLASYLALLLQYDRT